MKKIVLSVLWLAVVRGATAWAEEEAPRNMNVALAIQDITLDPLHSYRTDELQIATANGALSLLEIQGPSGKRLLIRDFLRGYNIAPGTILI